MRKNFLNTIKENKSRILLVLSICLVAFSTLFVLTKEMDQPKEDGDLLTLEDEKEQESISLNELAMDGIYPIKNNKDKEGLETTNKEDEITEDDKEENKELVEVSGEGEEQLKEPNSDEMNQAFIWPLEGQIITEFTTDGLIYSETLDEWRGHSGIDISGDLGAKVKAVKDGIVKLIEEDDLWGITITIEHGEGIETKYANLGTKEMVEEGIQIKQGDHIGTVGETANIEMLMDNHLHFETLKDGKLVDPRSILD